MSAWNVSLVFALAFGVTACTESRVNNLTAPTSQAEAAALTGTWVGIATDSSGTSMGMSTGSMGMGMTGGSMGDMTWQLTQTGGMFTGTARFSGFNGAGQMRVSGTMNGRKGSFTVMMPAGTMPMAGCSGQASGTFDMDDMMVMHGVYAGATSCSGPFDHGQMTMNKK